MTFSTTTRSLRAASKSGQSEGVTEDDPVGPMTPGSTTTFVTSSTPMVEKTSRKLMQLVLHVLCPSTDGGDHDDEDGPVGRPIHAT